MDNAPYHSREDEKIPTMATKKQEIVDFMKKNAMVLPEKIPTKPVLIGKSCDLGILSLTNVYTRFL